MNIQNFSYNEWFKWCIVRNLKHVDHHPPRIRKIGELFGDQLDFENKKFSIKTKDIHKIKKINSIGIGVFVYERKKVSALCVDRYLEKHADFLLKTKKAKTLCYY